MGGTKTLVGIGSSPEDLGDVVSIPTTDPEETLGRVTDHLRGRSLDSVGIASFGPIQTTKSHPAYGSIGVTPKPGWSGTDVLGPIQAALGVPVGLDTDVNGAALGERRWGAGRGVDSLVYITVGTGIGGGALVEGKPVHGLGHPEMGHISVRRDPGDDSPGVCRLHGDCLEGLASGPAIEARFGSSADRLEDGDLEEAVRLETFYLTQLVRNLVYTLAPERIILGGGVSLIPGLVERVGERLGVELAGYPGFPEHESGFVVPPGLGNHSGLAGGLVLAETALTPSS
jgi:fructokinase